jgi:UDP:flavonoid glycosyltransferase YjiC (YdhE family)
MLAVYVSGHGFGHSTRVAEVLRALRTRDPGCPLAIVTSAPAALFREAGLEPFSYRPDECDVGLAQHGALTIDAGGTVARWRELMQTWPQRVRMEADWLQAIHARLVLGDIPPLAFVAARAAGIPSVALANFSWDWIYRHLVPRAPALSEAAAWAAEGYAQAGRLLRLPFHGDMGAFGAVEDLPLVARRSTVPRDVARHRLALPDRPAVLLSFGGLGLPGFDARVLGGMGGYQLVATNPLPHAPDNLRVIETEVLERLGLTYVDLVAACDVVVTKPGYGIVSDCLGAGTRIVYTERGDFPEYPILVGGMSRLLPCAHVSNEDLVKGRWRDALEDVLGRTVPSPPDLSGAERAAERLLALQA